MNATTMATCGFALACSASFQAVQAQTLVQAANQPGEAGLNVFYETDPVGFKVTAQVEGATGPGFALVAGFGDTAQNPFGLKVVAYGLLDASGSGLAVTFVNEQIIAAATKGIFLRAAYLDGPTIAFTPVADTLLGTAPFCELLDFDYQPGPDPDSDMVAGLTIDNQWDEIGITISAVNSAPGHPDRSILFDTGNPTGGDTDLATPNLGAFGNDTALGNALIIAENEIGAPGLVTNPDDEAAGGSLIFDFKEPATICSVTLLDIDEVPGTELRFYRNGDLVTPDETMAILSLGDGSVQTVTFQEDDVDRFEVFFAGSGAIPMLELVPCPRIIDFDETSTGIPLAFQAGEELTDQYANIGVTISAVNDWVSGGSPGQNHPDKAILFDSENPTGGDTDLLTPNPGAVGNDTPLGFVVIVAEDDVDTSPADGFVDDPDDEAAGGEIRFEFDQSVTILGARVLDVDGMELDFLRYFDEFDMEIASILIPDKPDGNVQIIDTNISGVRKVVLDLGGSGAITRLRFCPDPDPAMGQ